MGLLISKTIGTPEKLKISSIFPIFGSKNRFFPLTSVQELKGNQEESLNTQHFRPRRGPKIDFSGQKSEKSTKIDEKWHFRCSPGTVHKPPKTPSQPPPGRGGPRPRGPGGGARRGARRARARGAPRRAPEIPGVSGGSRFPRVSGAPHCAARTKVHLSLRHRLPCCQSDLSCHDRRGVEPPGTPIFKRLGWFPAMQRRQGNFLRARTTDDPHSFLSSLAAVDSPGGWYHVKKFWRKSVI